MEWDWLKNKVMNTAESLMLVEEHIGSSEDDEEYEWWEWDNENFIAPI